MKPLSFFALSSAVALAACGRSRSTAPVSTAPAPARAETTAVTTPTPAAEAPAVRASALREAPRNWQLLDQAADGIPGISAERAMRELLATKQPRRAVVVAIIDSGLDTAHVDLRDNIWRNPKETPVNGKDDDGNGYADDVYGWNFIGGADGRDVQWDTFEVTRLFVRCQKADTLPAPERDRCGDVRRDFEKEKAEAQQLAGQVQMIGAALDRAVQVLKRAVGTDSLTTERVSAYQPSGSEQAWAKNAYLQLAEGGITPEELADTRAAVETRVKYNLNASYDPRPIVGDRYADPSERRYGNRDAMGPDAMHGTHVAGIVGAVRGNGVGVDGIAPSVRIMSVRTVPDGDERDKDVANAIRYAVDNGANVINMSFGKNYSPRKDVVDDAVRYADAHGVLMVHGSGNDGEDVTRTPDFPTPTYVSGGGRAQNWIDVGASSWKGGDSLAATFSNWGAGVDVFAPGVDILSTVPGGGYKRESGTSMAAPVVSGLAALLMAYYPQLTAADVKRIILASAARHAAQQVARPGDGTMVPFGSLSATGGIVNAYNAVRMAEEMTAVRP